MADPIKDIEDKKGQQDVGVMAFRVWEGAREEGASFREALAIICGWFYGLFKSAADSNEPENTDPE